MSESAGGAGPELSAGGASRWQRFVENWHSWRWAGLLLLVPGLALVVLFTLQPEPALTTGPALLVDNLLKALCLLTVVALVVLLIAREDIAERANLVASGGVLVLAAAVLMTGLWSSFRDVAVMALAGVAGLAALCNVWLHRSVWDGVRVTATKGLAALLTVAAVPLFSFWTETAYLPSRNTASLVGGVEVQPEQAADGSTHLVVSSVLENPSEVRAFVIVSSLAVCHWVDEDERNAMGGRPLADLDNCGRVGRPFTQSSWLDPKSKLTVRSSVRMQPGRPFVDLRLRVAYARADRVAKVPGSTRAADARELADCSSAQRSDLRSPSRLSSLALDGLSLMYADTDGDGGLAYYIDASDRLACQRTEGVRQLEQQLGLTEYTTVWVGWPAVAAANGSPNGR